MSALNFRKLLEEERKNAKKEISKDKKVELAQPFISYENTVKINQKNDCHKDAAVGHALSTSCLNILAPLGLETYKVGDIPKLYYIPEVVTCEKESELLFHTNDVTDAWTILKTRRLQCWGQFPYHDRNMNESLSTQHSILPTWLQSVVESLVIENIFPFALQPNNVLINQYTNIEGILHHTDGPKYHDLVAILSLESSCIMSFRPNLSTNEIGTGIFSGDLFNVILEPRSLLIFSDSVYSEFMHGIASECPIQNISDYGKCVNIDKISTKLKTIERGSRTSLTFRRLKSE
eukprot:gene10254-13791_t